MDNVTSSPPGIAIPTIGMKFTSEIDVREYYKLYGQSKGFGICKLGAKNGEDGKQKYFSLACAKSGYSVPKGNKIMAPRPSSKTKCKAKINVAVRSEDEYEITSLCLDHNHSLSPEKARHIRSLKILDQTAKRRLELNDEAGITLSKTFQSFVVEAGGYDNMTFDERTCRNFISEARRLRLGNGDAEALTQYFDRMRSRSDTFQFTYDLDQESRIKNVFWADGRCRAAYEYFSDVITFDTTYLTNRYDMPFAPFVGVNHHGQSILLGCGLLSSEDSESFVWLFRAWLTCMHGRAPTAIITDQCRSMAIAIEKVFPNTHHRYCLWHIMKKVPSKLAAHQHYESIKKQLKDVVYNSLTIEQCEIDWMKMIVEFKLEDNEWLNSLYRERCKWIPIYIKCHFWAGMSTSQRSESMNAFFDDYVHSKTSLKQFVEQYHRALKKNIETEKKLDFQSSNSIIPIVSGFVLERQFQSVYTNNIFKLFQKELRGLMFCNTSLVEDNGTTSIFGVRETILGKHGEHFRNVTYKVYYTPMGCNVKCQCQLFEFKGLLCKHILAVLNLMEVNKVPEYYIMERWRKDLKRGYQRINNVYDSDLCETERRRYNSLTPMIHEVQQLAAQSDENHSILAQILNDIKEKFLTTTTIVTVTASTSTVSTPTVSTTNHNLVHSPVKVRARGRPPTKRKQSTIEKVIKKSASKARRKANNASRVDQISSQELVNDPGLASRVHQISSQELFNDPGLEQLSFTDLLSSQVSNVFDSTSDYEGFHIQRR